MAAPCIAPQVELAEKSTSRVDKPKPAPPNQPKRGILADIFEGHEDFLGWTPD